MSLTYTEANVFLRFGEDMRFETWPMADFVRWASNPVPPPGYMVIPYKPTAQELTEQKWRRA